MDTYYTERANGRREFWTYCEGVRVYISDTLATRDVQKGIAKLVFVK